MHNGGMQFIRKHFYALLITTLAFVVVILVVPLLMRLSVERFIVPAVSAPQSQVALVLGASVVHGEPSPLLAERADVAIALYRAGTVQKILVTGDNGALSHDEVTPVRKYLLAAGIPPADIFLDHAGFDTYSSLYRAHAVFGVQSLIIATQDFHVSRALWIARALGLTAYGVVAPGATTSSSDYIREIPATFKAIWDVVTRRTPKYLGPAIPITGDGESTWY